MGYTVRGLQRDLNPVCSANVHLVWGRVTLSLGDSSVKCGRRTPDGSACVPFKRMKPESRGLRMILG